MNSTFVEKSLDVVMEFQRGYDLTHSEMQKGVIPVVGSSSVIGYHNKARLPKPALLIGRSGTVGRPQFFDKDVWPHNTTLFVKNFFENDPKFCFYLLKALNLESYATSTGVPTLNRNFIHPLKVKTPIPEVQQKIAAVLSALDDKIELNRKINAELEQMARTLYDYWFVQFDFPGVNGKPYKSSGGQMIYNDQLKREIPTGWSVASLSEISEIYQPKILSAKDLSSDGEYPVHGSNGVIGRYHSYNHDQSEVVVSCRGDCGNIHRTPPKTWITGNAMVFKPRSELKMHNEFLYQALRYVGLKQISTGSVQGQITRTNVEGLGVVLPDEKTLSVFNAFAEPIVAKKLLNNEESQKIAELRDWLLPMLMNGQVSVR